MLSSDPGINLQPTTVSRQELAVTGWKQLCVLVSSVRMSARYLACVQVVRQARVHRDAGSMAVPRSCRRVCGVLFDRLGLSTRCWNHIATLLNFTRYLMAHI